MSNLALCRVCLASNTKMQNIANTLYQNIFEKLSTKLHTEDKRPEMICYICYAQLQRCDRFIKMSLKAEEILTQFSYSGVELTEDTVNILDRKFVYQLSCTPLQSFSLYEAIDPQVKAEIKGEYCDSAVDEKHKEPINVKDEVRNDEPTDEAEKKAEGVVTVKEEIVSESEDQITKTEELTDEEVSVKVEHIGQELFVKSDPDAECELKGVAQEKCYEEVSITNPERTESKRFGCNHCDKSYTRQYHLYRHLRTNHGDPTKPTNLNICEICGKSFIQKSTLKMHLLNHSGVKRFACKLCPARCFQKIDLERHMRMHTGQKPFTCDICKESFSRKSNMKLHILTHADSKPFICRICNTSFSRKYDLTRHNKRKHTGEKPHSCDICDFRSVNASYMKTHVENKHTKQQGPFGCDKCDFTCSIMGYLKLHVQKKHSSDENKCKKKIKSMKF